MTDRSLAAVLDRFVEAHVLVVGDAILDHYIHGTVSRISPEAPVPVVAVEEERYVLGGAANVAHNVAALGGRVSLLSVRGRDAAGRRLAVLLKALRARRTMLIPLDDRPTTVKSRVVAGGQQVVRVDRERAAPIDEAARQQLIEAALALLDSVHAVVIEDYGKGVISGPLVQQLRQAAQRRGLPVLVDPKTEDALLYKGVDLITPNTAELREMAGLPVRNEAELERAARRLMRRLDCRFLLVTRGAQGMTLFGRRFKHSIPTAAKEVYDVSGAGDTVVAACALALAVGAEPAAAAYLANQAAGIVVARHGVVACPAADLRAALA